MKAKIFILILTIFSFFSNLPETKAQCPMCKTSVEKARENGDTKVGNTLNAGILYLFVFPYLIVGGFGYFYYKKYKKKSSVLNGTNQSYE